VAGRIRVLVLPGLPHKGDVIDWAAAGGTAEQLRELAGQAPDWEPLAPSAEATDEEAEGAADEAREKLIDELALMSSIEYERCRGDAAGELGMRRPALDRARQERREELDAERKPPPLFGHWITEPWPEEVDGDALVQAIVRRIGS